jgi:hypothetical protein
LRFATPEPTFTIKGKAGHTAVKGDEAAEGTEDTTAQNNMRTKHSASKRKRKVRGFLQRLKPVMEVLLANLRRLW